jgi:hypothetical protein
VGWDGNDAVSVDWGTGELPRCMNGLTAQVMPTVSRSKGQCFWGLWGRLPAISRFNSQLCVQLLQCVILPLSRDKRSLTDRYSDTGEKLNDRVNLKI